MSIGKNVFNLKRLLAPVALLFYLSVPAQAQEAEWKRLSDEAGKLYNQGQFAQAEAIAQQALAVAESTLGPDHPDVAANLNSLARLYKSLGRHAQAEQYYQRALAIYEKALGPEHPYVATNLNNLAQLYDTKGQYAQAEALYLRSLSIREKVLGQEHPAVAGSLSNLGLLYETKGQYAQAELLYRRALAIYEKTRAPGHLDVAVVLGNLAKLHHAQGQYLLAEPLFKRSTAIFQTARPEHPTVATSLNNLAALYNDQGKYPQAELLYKQALAIYEKALGPESPDVALSLHNLAVLYEVQGQYTQAEPLYQRALAVYEKTLGPDHPDLAGSLNGLAVLYNTQGQAAQAEPLYQRALAIYEKALGPEHPAVARSLNNLAVLYKAQGRYAQAEALYQRSLAIREKFLGPEHPDVAFSLNNLAELRRAQGRYEAAEPLYQRALAIRVNALDPGHSLVATSLGKLALLYRDQKRLQESLDIIRQSTRILARRAKLAAGNSTAQHGTTQTSVIDSLTTHATLIGQILPSVPPSARAKLIDEAYSVAQRASSGDTGAALAQMAARASAGNGPLAQKVRAQQDTIAAWRQFDKQLLDAIGKSAAQRNVLAEKDLRQKLSDAGTRIAQLNVELQRDFPEYRELISPEPLSVVDTQKLLKPDEALVSFLVADQETLLWVIRPRRVEMLRLGIAREALGKQVALLRQGTNLSSGDLPVFSYATAHALYKTLFAPAVPFLKGAKHVILVADGPLQSLPFGMLLSAGTATDKNAPWLIRQYAFSNLPAATSLRALRRFGKPSTASEPFMGFGDPILQGTPGEARGVTAARLFARGAVADTRELQGMARLPESADELRAIAKTLKAENKNVVLADAATEQKVKQTNLAPFRVLAFATHGLMAGEFKGLAEPALVLTPPQNPGETDDGLLTASEVAGLKLNADWVVLSACNTAAPDGTPGADGFSGLTKAFFYAGSQSLLVSHWAVASEATVLLTTRMFAEAEKGVGRAEALRRAMLAMVDYPTNASLRHPALWAPFVVVGEGGRDLR